MPFEVIQIPANGQGAAKEELNKLLRGGCIASVRKEFVANAEDSLLAFCVHQLNRPPSRLSRNIRDNKTTHDPSGTSSSAEAVSKVPGGPLLSSVTAPTAVPAGFHQQLQAPASFP